MSIVLLIVKSIGPFHSNIILKNFLYIYKIVFTQFKNHDIIIKSIKYLIAMTRNSKYKSVFQRVHGW